MIDRVALLTDLKKQVTALEKDLAQQVKALPETNARLRAEYDQAFKLGRTGATWNSWLDERITQVAVAWVLGTVFVRFCEDNHLIPAPYLAAPEPDRHDLSRVRYETYVEESHNPTYRGWLERAFSEIGNGQAGKLLFDPAHNPLFQIPISHDAAGALITFWKIREEGSLVRDFTDPLNEDGTEGWDTRFLGDLYQDLSESARATYALLQTPVFVEEFILDRTLDPAIREFGYDELRMVDPTCGSGHFVLGAFRRLIRLWNERQPGRDLPDRVRAALNSVHGVDINPFAIAIARFRLLVAAMAAAKMRTLSEAAKYEWPIHLAIGDSLIKSRQLGLTLSEPSFGDALSEFSYSTEDVHQYPGMLAPGRYHVVVGNPPYITVKDKSLNRLYREIYDSCAGKYALSVPFAQRFFELALKGIEEGQEAGFVGQVTSNSFMKREFGVKLIQKYFAHQVELTEVIDTSGAYIPGHGTPTVILIGKNRAGAARSSMIRTVRGVQGEPSIPTVAAEGLVWTSIVNQIDYPGSESSWVSVDDLERGRNFSSHPWILEAGGLEVNERIEANAKTARVRSMLARDIGFASFAGVDDAFYLPVDWHFRHATPTPLMRPIVTGEDIRDWAASPKEVALTPYSSDGSLVEFDPQEAWGHHLWRYKQITGRLTDFSGKTRFSAGIPWWSWYRWVSDRYQTREMISFSHVATHVHASFDTAGMVYNQHAPVIKLHAGATAQEHVSLVGVLNSSVACFWLRMVSHDKGRPGANLAGADEPWEHRFEFTGTSLEKLPLPQVFPSSLADELDRLSGELVSVSTPAFSKSDQSTPSVQSLRSGRENWERIRAKMIAYQEELDWQVYSLYGLTEQEYTVDIEDVPIISSEQRAFAIVLARKSARGEVNTTWFDHHNHRFSPTTEIPEHWPESYKAIVQKRIDAIETSRAIGMIERPEYKRRWATEGWDALQEKALRSWLLDRIEKREYWFDANDMPVLVNLSRLIHMLSEDDDFVSVAKLYRPRDDFAKVVADLMAEEHVPFLPSLRYKPTGLRKRADWEHVWDLQRQEDAAEGEMAKRKIRDSIPTPPKYSSADFLKPSYWRARGKLDVPKERFISYPTALGVQPQLFGWAGWDQREQAQALATYFTNQALTREEITPFLAGLLELQPWLNQWHDEVDPQYSGSPAAFFDGYRRQISGEHGLSDDDLRSWRPETATRGRKAARKK